MKITKFGVGLTIILVIGIIMTAWGISKATSSPGSITSHGQVELATTNLLGDGLSPADAFPDIAPGGQVTVVNSSDQVIGTGTLTQGAMSSGLVSADFLNFTVSVPAGLSRYGIEIGHDRGTVWFTPAEMKSGPGLSLEG
jgi:hypothetical protein